MSEADRAELVRLRAHLKRLGRDLLGFAAESEAEAKVRGEPGVPEIGSRWVWEIDLEKARSVIEVFDVVWNGEEWFVMMQTLLPDWYERARFAEGGAKTPSPTPVSLGRFWEAVSPVGPRRGAKAVEEGT